MKFTKKMMIAATIATISCSIAQANENYIDSGILESEEALENDFEIGGMLINETVSKFGHELFDAFKSTWFPAPQGISYNITINELFDQFRGSLISVKLNDNLIYQGVMSPKSEVIQELGFNLAREIRALLQRNVKLEQEEFF